MQTPRDSPGQQARLVETALVAAGGARGRPRHDVDRRWIDEGRYGAGQSRQHSPGVAVLEPGHQLTAGAGVAKRGN